MKKLLLTLMLVVASTSATAEWVKVAADVDEVTYYADPDTIRESGNMIKMWVMNDYKIVENLDGLSARSKKEFGCNKKQYRDLFISLHSGHMGRGETLFIHNERGDWESTPPDSVVEAILEFACAFHPTKMPETFPDETFS